MVPDNSFKNWVQNFGSKASSTNKTPEAQSEICGHQKTLKEYQLLPVEAPKDQHVDIHSLALDMNRSLRRMLQSDTYFHPYILHILYKL